MRSSLVRSSWSVYRRCFMWAGLCMRLWTAFASGTPRGFAGGGGWRFAEPGGGRSLCDDRMAVGESRRSSRSLRWTVLMARSSADLLSCRCGRLEFAERSVTSCIPILMTASGHNAFDRVLHRTRHAVALVVPVLSFHGLPGRCWPVVPWRSATRILGGGHRPGRNESERIRAVGNASVNVVRS
jgi:hypothetical protein